MPSSASYLMHKAVSLQRIDRRKHNKTSHTPRIAAYHAFYIDFLKDLGAKKRHIAPANSTKFNVNTINSNVYPRALHDILHLGVVSRPNNIIALGFASCYICLSSCNISCSALGAVLNKVPTSNHADSL